MEILNINFVTRITTWLVFIVFAISSVGTSFAYKESTHKKMSSAAFSRSDLTTDNSLMNDLGINAADVFRNSNLKKRGILELVLDGAEFEDAILAIDFDGEDLRMKHHFYNQQNSGSSLVYPPFLGPDSFIKTYSSADWALEDLSDIPEQNFSLKDASDAFYNALTDPYDPNREIHWGRVFQSLGHAIHHIQDMAQPQHTRNDAHTPIEDADRKLYESYTREVEESLTYLGYPDIDIAQFDSARIFWDGVSATEDMGLAEFSSENFVSEGTNFSGGSVVSSYVVGANPVIGQALPAADNLEITITEQIFNFTIPLSWLEPNSLPFTFTDITVSGTRHDIGTQVTDHHYALNSDFNERTSTFSVIDSDIDDIDGAMIYALDRTNFDAAYQYLIPKAVSYSAGLIDYFFRGRIEANISEDGDSIEIKNVSKGNFEFGVADAFEVYYETDSGTRSPINNLSNLLLVSGLPVNGTHTINGLSAALESITDMGAEGKIIVLFDGTIGSERGLAVSNAKANVTAQYNAIDVFFSMAILPINQSEPINNGLVMLEFANNGFILDLTVDFPEFPLSGYDGYRFKTVDMGGGVIFSVTAQLPIGGQVWSYFISSGDENIAVADYGFVAGPVIAY